MYTYIYIYINLYIYIYYIIFPSWFQITQTNHTVLVINADRQFKVLYYWQTLFF